MSDAKKRWVPVFFPLGKFQGSVNLRINGDNVVTAEIAKQMIDTVEEQHNASTDNNTGSTQS